MTFFNKEKKVHPILLDVLYLNDYIQPGSLESSCAIGLGVSFK
jgi:hypothetical protein